jgi:hypothetical protein
LNESALRLKVAASETPGCHTGGGQHVRRFFQTGRSFKHSGHITIACTRLGAARLGQRALGVCVVFVSKGFQADVRAARVMRTLCVLVKVF